LRSSRNAFAAHAFAGVALFAALGGCGGGASNSGITPHANPTPTAAATPPVWPSPVAFDVKSVANLAATNILPPGGGFAGTYTTQALFLKYTQATAILTSSAPGGVSPLAVTRRAQDVLPDQTLAYVGLFYTFAVPSAPMTLTLQIPQTAVVNGASYYLALWDPLRPSLGWQHDFAGPVKADTTSGVPVLTFAANAPEFTRYEQYWLAVYMLAASAAPPTPAPSIAPIPTPAPSPGAFVDVQTTMGPDWVCSGTPCATGNIDPPQPPQDWDIKAVPTPTVGPNSRKSEQLTLTPRDGEPGDVLYYTPSLGELPLSTDFTWDFWVMVDQPVWDAANQRPLTMQALEFDFNDASPGEPGLDYNFSSQCFIQAEHGGPVWQIWGQKGDTTNWIDSPIACDPASTFVPFKWTHITWTYRIHPDTQQTEYRQLKIEVPDTAYSRTYDLNIVGPAQPVKKQARPTIEVQFQQDARGITPQPSPFTEWIDDVTLTYR
jgi:hypothetical protein